MEKKRQLLQPFISVVMFSSNDLELLGYRPGMGVCGYLGGLMLPDCASGKNLHFELC